MTEVVTTDRAADWQAMLPASASVFGSVEFARIYENHSGFPARLLVVHDGSTKIVYPFFLRPLASLPFQPETTSARWDTVTPEFTGPIGVTPSTMPGFLDAASRVFRELGVVAEFIHLNPWSEAIPLLDPTLLRFNRELVYVDLTIPEDELWRNHFSHACRKNINRAQRENVRVFEASTGDDIREFHRIYFQTMDRNNALTSYYFPVEYFLAIFQEMKANARFMLADYQGKIVAATLYLHDGSNVYSYLGGADQQFQQVRPTNAIVNDTIAWGRSLAKKRLVLGGGYRPDDGIFRFKSSFSPLRARFHVYQKVHLADEYEAWSRAWSRHHGAPQEHATYFPTYRSTPPLQTQAPEASA